MTLPAGRNIGFACQTYGWQMSGDRYRGRVEHMASVAGRGGFAGLEPEAIMLGSDRSPARIAAILEEHGLTLAALAVAARWEGSRETDEERDEVDGLIELVRCFPGSKLVLVQLPGEDRSDLAVRQANALACINAVARRALDAGVDPTVHPNSSRGSVFRIADDYELLLEGLDPEAGFTPDGGHIVAGGMDLLETLKTYRDRVDHVHFKDIHEDGTWAPTGEGTIDFAGVVAYLVETDYRGWIVFEDESPASESDPDRAAERNGAYAADVLAPILARGRRAGETRLQ